MANQINVIDTGSDAVIVFTTGPQGPPGEVASVNITSDTLVITGDPIDDDNPEGTFTVDAPQAIDDEAEPTFAGLTLTGPAAMLDINGVIDLDSTSGVTALDIGGGGVNVTGSISSGTLGLLINNALPRIGLLESDAAAENRLWYVHASAERFNIAAVNDARSVVTSAFFIDRTGTTIDLVRIDGTEFEVNATMDFNGNADISGTLAVGGTTTMTGNLGIGEAPGRQLCIAGTDAFIRFKETATPATDEGVWLMGADANGQFHLYTRTDADATGATPIVLTRSGTSVPVLQLNATTLDLNGNLDADGTALDIDGSTSLSLHGGSADITLSGTEADITATTLDFNGTADFSSSVTINGALFDGLKLAANSAFICYDDTDAATDESLWGWGVNSNQFRLTTMADAAPTAIVATPINIQRSGTAITEIEFNATAFDFNGAADFSSTLTMGGRILRATAAGQTAAGTNQGNAHAITAEITQYSTVASGTGAILPSSIGTTFIVINAGANALNVYPPSGDAIDALGTNNPFVLPVGGKVMFICVSSSLFYTLNATYA